MEEALLLAPLAFVIVALMAGALLKVFLKNINVPYTVGLFLLGMVAGTLNVKGYLASMPMISDAIKVACDIDPDLILNIFLPILIFSAVYEIDIHIFRKSLVNSTLLAVPGMVISIALTALMMLGIAQFAPQYVNWNIIYALMFGALISATDPVAVVSMLGELGASKRFSTLIDGESMLNDGTGIVLFMLMFAPFTSSVDSASSSPVLSFLIVVFGGVLIGYALARTYLFYATRKGVKGDSMLQSSVMILLSYLTFILAQDIFKLSGVIALVAFGLVVAYHSAAKLEVTTQKFIKELWALMSYIANTLIFIIIGVIIAVKVNFTLHDFVVMVTVYIGINLIRMLMITMLYPLLKRNGYGLSKRESMILTWGALRGALGLTLALMVYNTEAIDPEVRRQVLGLTAGIVTMTLVINATTIKWLLGKLGLIDVSPSSQLLDAEVRAQLHHLSREHLSALERGGSMDGADWGELQQWLPKEVITPESQPDRIDLLAGLRVQLFSNERHILLAMYNRGELSFAAHRKLIAAIDELKDGDGHRSIDHLIEQFDLNEEFVNKETSIWANILSFMGLRERAIDPIVHYEVVYAIMVSLRELSLMVDKLRNTQLLNTDQIGYMDIISDEIERLESAACRYVEHFKGEAYGLYKSAMTGRALRMMDRYERKMIEEFLESGAIDEDAAVAFEDELNRRQPNG